VSERHLFHRLGRILVLTEQLLEERLGVPPSAEMFREIEAFRWVAGSGGAHGRLQPLPDFLRFELDDLIGVEPAIEQLSRNTEQFLAGHPSNHVLLYGERGTGKSSAVRGLLTRYAKQGLRMIEVRRDDLLHLPDVLEALRGAPQRFLLFCDDLSFGEADPGYRELKAALEGSLEGPPENVRIVATSNRRHLLPERHHENQEIRVDEQGEVRIGEAIDEKLALSDRFGLVLGFLPFDQPTYLRIVSHLLARSGADVELADVREEALRWALDRSSRSGRTARQFVDDCVGRLALESGR
jgi:hypothetical protein